LIRRTAKNPRRRGPSPRRFRKYPPEDGPLTPEISCPYRARIQNLVADGDFIPEDDHGPPEVSEYPPSPPGPDKWQTRQQSMVEGSHHRQDASSPGNDSARFVSMRSSRHRFALHLSNFPSVKSLANRPYNKKGNTGYHDLTKKMRGGS
jgi:hypothetical protein